jgi:hypothetical protein
MKTIRIWKSGYNFFQDRMKKGTNRLYFGLLFIAVSTVVIFIMIYDLSSLKT